jgi:4-hydroxyphenylpyruvate dioxygenase-like putative hemolysin
MPDSTGTGGVLLVASFPLGAADVGAILDDAALAGADVRVLVPSLNDSALAFWVSDADEAIAEARAAAGSIADALAVATGDAIDATVGESDPVLAVRDALRAFPATRIVTIYREGSEASHLEERLRPDVLAAATGLPVTGHAITTG